MKKLFAAVAFCLLTMVVTASAVFAGDEVTILFTGDIHDYIYPVTSKYGDTVIEHGSAARLKTLLDENRDENTIFVDCGDYSMGTLIQAAYSTDAFELRNLGLMGCDITTFGNHEFDYGTEGVISMLRKAGESGDALPQIIQSNIDFSGELTRDQQNLKDAFDEFGVRPYVIKEIGGYRIGFFGLMGYDCIECTQTELKFVDYKEAAREMVSSLRDEGCDVIVALSHAGTESTAEGEDIELAGEVEGIDLIISGHSHSHYDEPVRVGDTLIVSGWDYLKTLGKISFTVDEDGLRTTGFELMRLDRDVQEDAETAARVEAYKQRINETYLADEGVTFDEVIAHSNFDMISVDEMYATHQEYMVGNLIADSYFYEAERNGIDDIDVALVGLGTIRGSVKKGNISVADAFEICSLGVGADGSAGHPLITAFVSGKELKLLTELDASLGTLVSSIKMSYSGLEYSFNESRPILDRVTCVQLVRRDGTREDIEDDRLYKVCVNMYAANMLGMLNGLTKGILSITPKYQDGTPIEDFYTCSLTDTRGKEIKEWVAFKNYLMSFEKNAAGISEIPARYEKPLGRKYKYSEMSLTELTRIGTATNILCIACLIVILAVALIVFIIIMIIRGIRKRRRSGEPFTRRIM